MRERPKKEKQMCVSVESMPNTVIHGVLIRQARHLTKKKKKSLLHPSWKLFFAQAQHTDNHFLDMSPCCSGLARKLYENADQVSLNHYMTLLLALVIDSALSMDFFF